jgi:hypothetical protein
MIRVVMVVRQEGIDSEELAALDDNQLKELGVKRMGDRTKVSCITSPHTTPDHTEVLLASESTSNPRAQSLHSSLLRLRPESCTSPEQSLKSNRNGLLTQPHDNP